MGALLGLPIALGSRARAQQSRMDIRIIEAVISYGGGIYNALQAGISPLALNTGEMLGIYCGLTTQLRHYGGSDDYLNLYSSTPAPACDPDLIYSALAGHYGPSPKMRAGLIDAFRNLPEAAPGMYDALFAAGGHDNFNNLVAGVFQYYEDLRGGPATPAPQPRYVYDPYCDFDPEYCWIAPPDPCDLDPLACWPPFGPIPGIALPWADADDPYTPKPRHGLTKADVCWYAGKGQWYLGQIAAIYSAILRREGVLITLTGEVIIATPVATEVLAAIGIGLLIASAIGQIAC
jgi:hypothetical protein